MILLRSLLPVALTPAHNKHLFVPPTLHSLLTFRSILKRISCSCTHACVHTSATIMLCSGGEVPAEFPCKSTSSANTPSQIVAEEFSLTQLPLVSARVLYCCRSNAHAHTSLKFTSCSGHCRSQSSPSKCNLPANCCFEATLAHQFLSRTVPFSCLHCMLGCPEVTL